jgi:hypothetical protein
MNPTDTIQYLTKQAEFCADRALAPSNSEAQILSYATRADIYYTIAAAMCIFFGVAPRLEGIGKLGDADDKARELQS